MPRPLSRKGSGHETKPKYRKPHPSQGAFCGLRRIPSNLVPAPASWHGAWLSKLWVHVTNKLYGSHKRSRKRCIANGKDCSVLTSRSSPSWVKMSVPPGYYSTRVGDTVFTVQKRYQDLKSVGNGAQGVVWWVEERGKREGEREEGLYLLAKWIPSHLVNP